MKRRVYLYIDGQLADLDDDAFILYNYTQEDMSAPAAILNSFTQQIELPGTPDNDLIFGFSGRFDRITATDGASSHGIAFDALKKTPFVIYDERDDVLESGYVKLDEVKRDGASHTFAVTLYGGLGAFIYGLTYDADGNKRTLADVSFTNDDAEQFVFTVNVNTLRSAWSRLHGDNQAVFYDIINFMPAYNGLPQGVFDANKALLPWDAVAGLVTYDEGYTTKNGFALATLQKKYTEWEVKDLRTYLQRPVLRMKKLINALCTPDNNGGYVVDLDSGFFNSSNPYYEDTWLTLPILNTLSVNIGTGSGSLTPAEDVHISIPGGGNTATNYKVLLRWRPEVTVIDSEGGSDDSYSLTCADHYTEPSPGGGVPQSLIGYYLTYIDYTLTAYDSNGNYITQSKIRLSSPAEVPPGYELPIDYEGVFYMDEQTDTKYFADTDGNPVFVEIGLEAMGVSYVVLTKTVTAISYGVTRYPADNHIIFVEDSHDYNVNYPVSSYGMMPGYKTGSYNYKSNSAARSGAVIHKADLLTTEHTPADYLVSYCKMFGLQILVDKVQKRVSIMRRQSYFQDATTDLTALVDRSKPITVTPYTIDSRWYDFASRYDDGEFVNYYANVYAKRYAVHRVDTGYAFNAEINDVMESVIYRGAAEVQESSKYFVNIELASSVGYLPPVCLDGGKYVLWDGEGNTREYDLPVAGADTIVTFMNADHPTYDAFSKVQFHDADNKGYEERDTLVFYRGFWDFGDSSRYAMTDDTPVMLAANDNTPCWVLDYQLMSPGNRVRYMPIFSRYRWSSGNPALSLDFGTPAEVQIQDADLSGCTDIFSGYWADFIADRYHRDGCIMRCHVDLSSFQVNEQLLRRFWYYDGCLWALNKIINHSLTTDDLTECEFVRVMDKTNYTA